MTTELANRSTSSGWISASLHGGRRLSPLVSGGTPYRSGLASGVPVVPDGLTPFERERRAFLRLAASGQFGAFHGQFVAVHQGRFAGANPSQRALVRNFFGNHDKRASVYIGFIGPRRIVHVRPFAVRRTS
jgi:hypothetical protein